jgi:hypothetical protein
MMEHESDPDDWGRPTTVHTGGDRRELLRCARAARTDAGVPGRAFSIPAAADGDKANAATPFCGGSGCGASGGFRSEKSHAPRMVSSK